MSSEQQNSPQRNAPGSSSPGTPTVRAADAAVPGGSTAGGSPSSADAVQSGRKDGSSSAPSGAARPKGEKARGEKPVVPVAAPAPRAGTTPAPLTPVVSRTVSAAGTSSRSTGGNSAPEATPRVSTTVHAGTPPAASGDAPATSPAPAARRQSGGWLAMCALILVLAVAGWWYMQQRLLAQDRQNAARLQASESRAASLEEQIRQLRDGQQQLQSRGNALETRVAESATQQEQLQALYDDVARVRGDARLAEVERALALAKQHLALSGNVKGALLALEGAEKQLGDSEQAQAIGLRRVILQDIEKLKALPEVDLARSVARLDEVLSRVDTLPFLGDPNAPAVGASVKGAQTTGADVSGEAGSGDSSAAPGEGQASGLFGKWYRHLETTVRQAARAAYGEFTGLVKIHRLDDPGQLMLGPDQKRSIREGLRLQLLSARIDLLNRNEPLFRQDLSRSADMINRFFDSGKPETRSSINLLTELQSEPLQLNLPTLSDSVAALSAARAESEKRFR
ncbi:MAG: uroporphyrinogen-III C-methyltransferase [Lautropia sp.]|nr:uroporphyrinogen-III C-methyltransferase [Lautropia sp.]